MSLRAVCVILAAGRSQRMGEQKLLLRVGGKTLLDRAFQAAAAYPRIVVTSPSLASHVAAEQGVTIVVNDAPERGMAHSLALADAAVHDRAAALVVLLADAPFVDAATIERVVAALGDADVAYPVRDGLPGHPVVFGPRPRTQLATLPDGDTLRTLRADRRWTRVEVPFENDRPFTDVDTPADLAAARLALEASPARGTIADAG